MGKHKQAACQICFNFMRSDHVKDHMKVHQKYSLTNKTPKSTEDMCRDLVLEIVDKVVFPVEEIVGHEYMSVYISRIVLLSRKIIFKTSSVPVGHWTLNLPIDWHSSTHS